jgi:LPPG:FO 2-phospho-L-lactate transferase
MLAALGMVVPPDELVGIVNVGDDLTLHGLRICPDLDTITYTLAGLNNTETGWGLAGETWRVMEELRLLGGEAWFSLGDRDLATHLYRTQRLADGASLGQVTAELLDHAGVATPLLPATEDPLATTFTTVEHGTLSFQEYFVRHHHDVPVEAVSFVGAEQARPGPGVLDALDKADRIVISPSNPLISIAPILAIPGIVEALAARRDDVVAVSPLIGGRALKGPADRLLDEIGHGASAEGVARSYAHVAGTLVIDNIDTTWSGAVEAAGMRCLVTETLMDSPERAAHLGQVVLDG